MAGYVTTTMLAPAATQAVSSTPTAVPLGFTATLTTKPTVTPVFTQAPTPAPTNVPASGHAPPQMQTPTPGPVPAPTSTQTADSGPLPAATPRLSPAPTPLPTHVPTVTPQESDESDGNPPLAVATSTPSVRIQISPISALLIASNMVPGDVIETPLTVINGGNLELRYAIRGWATNADGKSLRDSLKLRIGLKAGANCDSPYYTNDGTPTNLFNDSQLYEGLGFPATATDMVGAAIPGNQSGDRSLSSGDSEVLCFAVALPSSAGNSLQGAASTITFEFVSEQTANNP